jgi:hypothetical protein
MEELLGKTHISRVRASLMNVITAGDFEEFVARQLSPLAPSIYIGMNRVFSIGQEDDQDLAKMRLDLYQTKRQYLLKLAESKQGFQVLEPVVCSTELYGSNFHDYVFNCRRNIGFENQPDDVANTIRFASLARNNGLYMLPKLIRISRVGAEVKVRCTNRPVTLRSLIDDRLVMQEHGQALVQGLLKAFLQLQEAHISLRTIQPSSIRFHAGEWQPLFSDISHACTMGSMPADNSPVSEPYSSHYMKMMGGWK